MLAVLVLVVIVIGGYYLSLVFNPMVKCSKCHGKPRPQGWVFSYAHHVCPKCEGTGQQVRLGRKLLRMERNKSSS